MSLTINEQIINDIVVLKASGEIDTYTAYFLEEKIREVIDQGKKQIAVNLSDVSFVSSAGWGVFMANSSKLRNEGGDLKVVGMIDKVKKAFELIELDNLIDSYEEDEAAIKSF